MPVATAERMREEFKEIEDGGGQIYEGSTEEIFDEIFKENDDNRRA